MPLPFLKLAQCSSYAHELEECMGNDGGFSFFFLLLKTQSRSI